MNKLRRRARTLLIPYLFWNLLAIVFLLLCQIFLPDVMSGRRKGVMDYGVSDWLWNFWNASKVNGGEVTSPVNAPLWFLRDLMVVVLCSPLVYWCVRWLKHYGVILLGIVWILGPNSGIAGVSAVSFFFFTAGAYFSINGKNFVTILRPIMKPAIIIYLLLAAVELCFRGTAWVAAVHLYAIGILAGMVVVITMTAYFIEQGKWRVSTFLAASSFFVYAYHSLPQVFINNLAFRLVHPHSDESLLLLYVVCPTLTILLGAALY